MDSIEFLKEKMRWLKLLSIPTPATRLGMCSIGITPQGFTIVYVHHESDQIEFNLCETVPCTPETFQSVLTNIVKEYNLTGVKCVWILQPEEYLLFTMEELPVSAEEFQGAIRWKIKKLLPYSVDDAVVDYFTIPAQLITDPKKNMTVVVSQASHLNPIADKINNAGLNLWSIDISELGLRNISNLYETDESSSALVYLREKNSLLSINRLNEFYMSRRLDLDIKAFNNATDETLGNYLDQLALQLQRSFDYYHSQWRRPTPDKLLIASAQPLSLKIQEQLAERLTIKVIEVNLNEKLLCKNQLTLEQQSNSLAIIGGALRTESKHNAAN
jgi:MSHA biogenesis protein MshI